MAQAELGDTVRIHYTGTLSDKSQFDSTVDRDPLKFTLGEGQVLKGVDDAVTGMAPGENKTVTIPAEEAYGLHRSDHVHEIARERIPPEIDLKVGTVLQSTDQSGEKVRLIVTKIVGDTVTLDRNHPLAGKDLTFDLTLVEIV